MIAANTGLTKEMFLGLKPPQKMALLNIEAKLRERRLKGTPLLSFIQAVRYVAVDRIFVLVQPEMKQIIEDSSEFASAPGHKAPKGTPVVLPNHPDSWKHRRFGAGDIQLSFSKVCETLQGIPSRQVFSVDSDIDLERGLGHVFEWLDNHVLHPGKKTDQTQVYFLLFSQGIIPDYTLDPLAEVG